jgi:hypothetical protein
MSMKTLCVVGGMVLATTVGAWAVRADGGSDTKKKAVVAAPSHDAETKAGARATWLRVEVRDGATKEGDRVSVRVPIAVLRLLGREATVDVSQFGVKVEGAPKKIAIAELLDAIEPGTTLVEIEEATSHVKVWVE